MPHNEGADTWSYTTRAWKWHIGLCKTFGLSLTFATWKAKIYTFQSINETSKTFKETIFPVGWHYKLLFIGQQKCPMNKRLGRFTNTWHTVAVLLYNNIHFAAPAAQQGCCLLLLFCYRRPLMWRSDIFRRLYPENSPIIFTNLQCSAGGRGGGWGAGREVTQRFCQEFKNVWRIKM